MNDSYLEVVYQQWSHIVMLYERYADKRPVMLFDIQEQRIYALPYEGYRAELSKSIFSDGHTRRNQIS